MRNIRNLILFLLILAMSVPSVSVIDASTTNHDVKTVDSTKWYMHGQYTGCAVTITVGGIPAFCLDSTKLIDEGKNGEITPESIGLNDAAMNKLSLIAWYGYRSKAKPTERDYQLTQNLIWQVTADIRGDSNAKKNNYAYSKEYPTLSSMQPWFDNIMKKVDNFNKLPSFDGKTFTVKAGTTLKVPDTNGVLKELTLKNHSSIGVRKSGNNLLIDAWSNSKGTETIVLDRGMTTQQTQTNFVVSKGGTTQPVSLCYSGKDPYNSFVKVNVVVDLQLAKKNPDGNLVPNTKFKVSYNADMSNPIGTYTTGSAGVVIVPNLQIGKKVYIQEVTVPAYLQLDTKIYSKSLVYAENGVNYYTATNEWADTIKLQLAKKDPNLKLIEGTQFKVSYNADMSNPIGTYTTGPGGVVIVPNLRAGAKVYIQETSAPMQLKRDGTVYEKQLGTDSSIMYYFTLVNDWNDEVRLQLAKKDYNGNLYSGARFAVSYNADMSNPIGEYYIGSDATGITVIDGLYAGSTVYIQETYVVPHLELDHTIYKKELGTDPNILYYFTLQNKASTATKLQLAKKDPDGNLVPNTTFKLWYKGDYSGKYWTYTTGENGTVIVDPVYEMQSVCIQEIDAPDHLVLDSTVYTKNLWVENNGVKQGGISMYYYTAVNEWTTVPLEIAKKDPDGNLVPNTTFAVSYNSDMSDFIGEFTTGESGKVIVPDLLLKNETVYVQEVDVPEHLELDNTIIAVKLEKDDNGNYSYIMENNWKKVPLEITKKDPNGNFVPNTTFKLSYNSDMSNPIGTYTTGSDGKILVENLLVKTIYIQEIDVPAHLRLDSTIYSMTLVDVNPEPNYYTAINEFALGNLKIVKTDSDGNYVEGVTFKISYDSTMSNPIGEFTTNSDGIITIENLNAIDVYIQEISVPENLQLDTTIYKKTIQPNELVIFNITNKIKEEYKKEIHVSKIVNGNASNKEKEFKFFIWLSDSSINGQYGDVNFVNGEGEFYLKNGESISILNLSKGVDYSVSEQEYEDYITAVKLSTSEEWNDSSNIIGKLDDSVMIEFKNTKETVVDTGLNLNSKLYIIIFISTMVVGSLMYILKKRYKDEE